MVFSLRSNMIYYLLLVLSASSAVAAEEMANNSLPNQMPLTEVEGDPSSIVGGYVNAISGALIETDTDIVLPGPEPLIYQRIYCSKDWNGDVICDGWTNNHAENAYLHHDGDLYTISAAEASGGSITYWGHKARRNRAYREDFYPPPEQSVQGEQRVGKDKGLTNTGMGDPSGNTNLKNQSYHYCNHAKHIRGSLCDGTTRTYYPAIKPNEWDYLPLRFVLSQESRPSGSTLSYDYYIDNSLGKGKIRSIKALDTTGGQLFSQLLFDYSGNVGKPGIHEIKGTASDGRQITYRFCHFNFPTNRRASVARRYLSEVIPPNGPKVSYEYTYGDAWQVAMLSEKKVANRAVLKVNYYDTGKNQNGDIVATAPNGGARCGNVSMLQAPVGADATLIPTHCFVYWDGWTDVRDAYNQRTIYRFNDQERITSLERYTGSDQYALYSSDRFYWGDPNTHHACDLCCKALLDARGNILSCRAYEYDTQHNAVAEHLAGNLSGLSQKQPVISDKGTIQTDSCECYTIHRTFTDDAFRLLKSETLPNGRFTEYQYQPNSNLLIAKLIKDPLQIIQREFHTYNANGTLVKTIRDDGIGTRADDLSGVMCRTITYISPKTSAPCVGLPEEVREYYLDLDTGREVLLKGVKTIYSLEGWKLREEHFDATDTLTHTLVWGYDQAGNAILEQDASGQVTTRRFDAFNNKIFEQTPDLSYYTEYTYDNSNRLINETRVCKNLPPITHSYRYDYLHRKIASIDACGHETRYDYDTFGRLIKTHLPAYRDAQGNQISLCQERSYDEAGNIIRLVDFDGNVTVTSYNVYGKPVYVQHPDDTQEIYVYNLDGTLQYHTAVDGVTTRYFYNVLGLCTRKELLSSTDEVLAYTTSSYKGGRLIASTDANGNLTTYTYDGAGRIVREQRPDTILTTRYDNRGRKARVEQMISDKEGDIEVKVFVYDPLDRLIEERVEDSRGTVFIRTAYGYDAGGRKTLVKRWNSEGEAITQTEYDGYGKICRTTDAEGHISLIQRVYTARNDRGEQVLQVTQIDPLGQRSVATHDVLGRPECVTIYAPSGEEIAHHMNTYDSKGRIIQRQDSTKSAGLADHDYIVQRVYDSRGRVIKLIEAAQTPLQRQTAYTYNKCGQKEQEVLSTGVMLHHAYDQLGRLAHLSSSDNSIDYHYTYDAHGNLVHVYDAIHKHDTHRVYDAMHRIIQETLGNELILHFNYDGLGRLIELNLPDESVVSWTYDAAFMRSVDRQDRQGVTQYIHQYLDYDLAGNVMRVRRIGKAGEALHKWDKLMRAVEQSGGAFTETVPPGGYDAAGNLIAKTRTDAVGSVPSSYRYDARYRLIAESTHQQHSYSYDSLDNRLSMDNKSCECNALHLLLSQGDINYTYDNLGFRSSRTQGANKTAYRYDALGRLIELTTQDTKISYVYDSFNRRLSKAIQYWNPKLSTWYQPLTTRYVYQQQMEIGVVDMRGHLRQFRALGQGLGAEIAAAVAIEMDSKVYAPIHDHTGNIVTLVDAGTGEVAEVYRYSAFGEETCFKSHGGKEWRPANIATSPWRFASKRTDSESALINFGRRYYDPEIGRWLTPDPAGYGDGPNRYSYKVFPQSGGQYDSNACPIRRQKAQKAYPKIDTSKALRKRAYRQGVAVGVSPMLSK